MFIERRGQKPQEPHRGVMVGHLQARTQNEQLTVLNITPRWGWQRQEALSYKHRVPTGLERDARSRRVSSEQKAWKHPKTNSP